MKSVQSAELLIYHAVSHAGIDSAAGGCNINSRLSIPCSGLLMLCYVRILRSAIRPASSYVKTYRILTLLNLMTFPFNTTFIFWMVNTDFIALTTFAHICLVAPYQFQFLPYTHVSIKVRTLWPDPCYHGLLLLQTLFPTHPTRTRLPPPPRQA
jgi:hypothetical protein